MTDKEWNEAIAVIEGLRWQLANTIMPLADRAKLHNLIRAGLLALAALPSYV